MIPTLQKMGVESSLWHQHLLLAVDAGYGRSEFLAALARLYKAFGLVKGELDKKSVREYILLPKGQEQAADGYRVTWETLLDSAQDMSRSNARNGIAKDLPAMRIGYEIDVVGPAIFLASAASDMVTATTIYPDGGLVATS